jgi:hypothetical protein
MDIGCRRELFVDSYLIDSLRGAGLKLHSPRPAGTVLPFDRPWEGRYCGYITIIPDGPLYRMYYRGHPVDAPDGSPSESTCYAESEDGISWTKPSLGLFEVHGTRDNNVILSGFEPLSHNFSPFIDTRPGVAGDERFKAVAGTHKTGLIAFVSADGIHWAKLRDEPITTDGMFDSQNLVFCSESEQCYVCYMRTWSGGGFKGLRTISRATSDDFLNWTSPTQMTFGDTPLEELYTNQTLPYFRAPHIYTAIAARFMPGRKVLSDEQFAALGGEGHYGQDCSDSVFMTSRGGTVYDRTFMESFVRPGMGLNNWTSRTNYAAYGIVPTGDGEMSFYITRNYGQETCCLERLVLRLDGFASVNAGYDGGEMITKPFAFEGSGLSINYSTSAAGSVWVEIQDADGKPIAGFTREDADEIIGDEIERVVTWGGSADVSGLAGRAVRLRFVMKDADVYALRFG